MTEISVEPANIFGGKDKGEKRENNSPDYLVQQAPDEYKKRASIILSPQRETFNKGVNTTARTREHLDYLGTTKSFEIDTPRVQQLQGYVDRMTEGSEIASGRIVIMERGESAEAFVLPDGTICINQELINQLDTMDELVGVLGHELGHIKNHSESVDGIGVCWTHETASDLGAPQLAEKIGFNSTGLASAIQKISANSRGTIHQSGEMRGAQIMGTHAMINYATSDTVNTPIPQEWKTTEVKPTNLELARQLIKDNAVDEASLTTLVAKLHIWELRSLYAEVKQRPHIEACRNIITERLTQSAFTSDEITHFLIDYEEYKQRDIRIIATPDDIVRLAGNLEALEQNKRLDEMHRIVFDANRNSYSPTNTFISYITRNLFIDDGNDTKAGVPINNESLLNTLSIIQTVPLDTESASNRKLQTAECIAAFLNKKYFQPSKDGTVRDEVEFESTVKSFQEAGIKMDRNACGQYLKYVLPEVEAEQVLNMLIPLEELDKIFVERGIDQLFRDLDGVREPDSDKRISAFVTSVQAFFNDNKLDDRQREPYIQFLLQKMDHYVEHGSKNIDKLKFSIERTNDADFDKQKMLEMRRVILKHQFASNLYEKHNEEYYRSLHSVMETTSLDPEQLSVYELYAINAPLLQQFHDTDYREFMTLPFIEALQRKNDEITVPTNIHALSRYTLDHYGRISVNMHLDSNIFSDSLSSLFVYSNIREAFQTCLENGIAKEDRDELVKFMDRFVTKDATTNRVRRKFLYETLHEKSTIPEKVDFLQGKFDELGYEGVTSVAEQITTMEEYELLREALGDKLETFLQPNNKTTLAAGADIITSYMTQQFDKLLSTASSNPINVRETSTYIAHLWLGETLKNYQPATKKFDIYNHDEKTLFRSVKDLFTTLQDLSESQRAALVMKSLLDVEGGLTTGRRRQTLGNLTVSSLELEDDFIKKVIQSACEVADAKVVGYPLAVLFAPLLFKSLDSERIDPNGLMYASGYGITANEVMTYHDIKTVVTSSTPDIVQFGPHYKKYPGTYPAELADKAQDEYMETYRIFNEWTESETSEENATQNDLDPGIEAVIKGIQASGAVGVRSLQLARQLREFSPAVEKRLSATFDSNPGLNKLLFWENLHNLRKKVDIGDLRYAEAGKFVAENIVSVGDKLGGGSLYTTYDAMVRDQDGQEVNAVIKILNPNATLVIESFYKVALDTLEKVKEEGDLDAIRQAEQSLMLVEMAQQWCLADINDPSFEADDTKFSSLLEGFNDEAKGLGVSSPRRIFNSFYIKSEIKEDGQTLNAVLNDATIPPAEKKRIVDTTLELFNYELSHPVNDNSKNKEYLLRSDPNPGNFMVNRDTEQTTVAILDRNLFLHLSEQEVSAIKALWEGKPEVFFDGFIRSLFKDNNVALLRQPLLGRQFKRFIVGEVEKAGGKDQVNPLRLMQSVTDMLNKKGLEVPLKMHLAIKNVFALQELKRRYADFDDVE